ncbi:MAG TPA: hypothetical protein DF774_05155 [Rheinheimera sp.]|uniref:SapC family protein n=1 Tax=Rheinheimera sp. TaxID=1869214 RepID=UPI000EB97F1C|nr:SapC family protein [Rheinheimera sp.]HCU65132.1 hypothetical protein [Rheinheimera sp.]
MLAKPVPLSNETHKDLKILPKFSLEAVNGRNVAPLMLQEFVAAAPFFPIFFLKNQDNSGYNAVAVYGLKEEQNLFVENETYTGGYLPASIRTYPFTLAQAADDQLVLCVNEQADNVSRTEGQAMFNEDGSNTEFFDGVNKFFRDYIDSNTVSRNIVKQMEEMDLFKADGLQYTDAAGNQHRLDGFFVINREKFEALSDEQFLSLRKFGVLPAIYAHFSSLDRIGALIQKLPVTAA